MLGGRVPHHVEVKLVVAVNEPVAHSNNFAQIGKGFCGSGNPFVQTNERLTDDRQFALQGCLAIRNRTS